MGRVELQASPAEVWKFLEGNGDLLSNEGSRKNGRCFVMTKLVCRMCFFDVFVFFFVIM